MLMETYMKATLAVCIVTAFALVSFGCATVALAPGADRVLLTKNAADVASCKTVGNVKSPQDGNALDAEPSIRNQAVGLGANAIFITRDFNGGMEGVAYHCP
jgi:hypothetical protein